MFTVSNGAATLAFLCLLVTGSGCKSGAAGAFECINDGDCPPQCECEADFVTVGICENGNFDCGGSCDRELECPAGTTCRLATTEGELQIYECLADTADTVLDQPRNDDWDYFSDASCDPAQEGCPNVVAENFLVPSTGAAITEIVIWGGWWPTGTRTSDAWTVIIHADAAGLPGTAVYTQANFAAASIQNIGQIFGVGYYEVTLELTGDVDLPPGTHWIEIFHDSGAGDFWFWVTGDADPANGLPGFAEAPEAPGMSWSAHDVDSEPPLRRSLAIRISG